QISNTRRRNPTMTKAGTRKRAAHRAAGTSQPTFNSHAATSSGSRGPRSREISPSAAALKVSENAPLGRSFAKQRRDSGGKRVERVPLATKRRLTLAHTLLPHPSHA